MTNTLKHVVAAVITDAKGKILLQQRDHNPGIACPGKWSLFGGVVEPEETPKSAILRELKEETGITFHNLRPLKTIEWEGFLISLFRDDMPPNAVIRLGEGNDYGLFTKEQVLSMDLAFCYNSFFREVFQKLD